MFAGIVFAKYDLLDKIKGRFAKCRVPIKIFAALTYTFMFFCLRVYNGFAMYDFILVPFFIAISSEAIASLKGINTVFEFLGKNSTNMWLVHSFFCYRFSIFVKIVYSSNEIVNLLILIALSLAASVIIDGFYSLLKKAARKNRQAALRT